MTNVIKNQNEFICDLCGSHDFVLLYDHLKDTALPLSGEFEMRKCGGCGLIRRTPDMSDQAIAPYYPAEYVPYASEKKWVHELKKLFWRGDRALVRRLAPSGSVVYEIGAAEGEFLEYLGDSYTRFGMDMDKVCIERGIKKYGLTLSVGNIETLSLEQAMLPPINIIFMSYVLEHLHSPREVLKKMRKMLAPQGVAIIKIPNFNSWERRVFGRYWHSLDIPRHVHIFTREHMLRYAAETGFALEETHYSFVPNDWIESIARFLRSRGKTTIARFFNYKNPIAAALFLPLSILGKIFGESPRMTVVLRALE